MTRAEEQALIEQAVEQGRVTRCPAFDAESVAAQRIAELKQDRRRSGIANHWRQARAARKRREVIR